MAGDWIKMRGNLWDDPRVSRICDLTDSTEGPVIGALYWLWSTADQHSEDGAMPGLTLRQIDRKTGLQGFAEALCDVGWLVDDPQGVVIQKFEEHNGDSAKKRCQTAKRVANHRSGNAEVTQPALQEKHKCVSGALAREEKRREEQIQAPPPPEKSGGAFAAFWESWPKHPRKVAKAQCAAKWRKHCEPIAGTVMAALEAAKASEAWAKQGGEFIPAPLVWLNQARWEAPTEADAAAQQQAEHWHDSRSGIEAKGESLSLGRWDETAFQLGRGEPWPAYRARVYRAAGHEPMRAA